MTWKQIVTLLRIAKARRDLVAIATLEASRKAIEQVAAEGAA